MQNAANNLGTKTHGPALFPLGQIVSTPGALAACSPDYLYRCLFRHSRGDWGKVCKEDAASNRKAVSKDGGRILSSYPIDPDKPCDGFGKNTIWIITEADRSVTTFLLPEEY
jgi:hypothetical protein